MQPEVLRAKLLLDGPPSREALAKRLLDTKQRLDEVLGQLEESRRRVKHLEAVIRRIDGRPVPRMEDIPPDYRGPGRRY